MTLSTERLRVRSLNTSDKTRLFEIYSDKEAMKYRGSKPFETLDEVDAMLSSTFQKIDAQTEFRYAVELNSEATLIGTFLLKPLNSLTCEIGYSLDQAYWGQGYAKELLLAMMTYIKQQGIEKIIANSRRENTASMKLLERVGFQLVSDNELNDCYGFDYVL